MFKNNKLALSIGMVLIVLITLLVGLFVGQSKYVAAEASGAPQVVPAPSNICDIDKAGPSTFCTDKTKAETSNPIVGEDSVFKKILKVLVYATSIISVIMIMIGGLRYVFSGGDANGVKGAKDTILYAIIGLVIALFGQVIITFVLDKL